MAEDGQTGNPWNDDELDAIVADYFSMLGRDLTNRPYVKARHNAALRERIGRTPGSVEFKHQNISAVLEELGMPWIPGYKPMRNYQGAILDAIDRYLSNHSEVTTGLAEPGTSWVPEESVFVDPPVIESQPARPERLERLVRKFDPAERDQRNRALGRAGEEFVVRVEKDRLARQHRDDLAHRVRWISDEEGDGAGFDVLSFDPSGRERRIEVKTTNGAARTPFFLSRNEREVSIQHAEKWRLYRVHLFAQRPSIFALEPPLSRWVSLRTETWRASFSAAAGMAGENPLTHARDP